MKFRYAHNVTVIHGALNLIEIYKILFVSKRSDTVFHFELCREIKQVRAIDINNILITQCLIVANLARTMYNAQSLDGRSTITLIYLSVISHNFKRIAL